MWQKSIPLHLNFNSTLVRLKATIGMLIVLVAQFQFHFGTIKSETIINLSKPDSSFQFHFGTIKSFLPFNASSFWSTFQFHFGTIKRPKPWPWPDSNSHFNSTLVRLKVIAVILHLPALLFQFHFGTIKRQQLQMWLLLNSQFQFHFGTIKSRIDHLWQMLFWTISIPLWYD